LRNRFFTAISDRPGRNLAMSLHLFPSRDCASKNILTSSSAQGSYRLDGSKMLIQRSRICSAVRPSTCLAIQQTTFLLAEVRRQGRPFQDAIFLDGFLVAAPTVKNFGVNHLENKHCFNSKHIRLSRNTPFPTCFSIGSDSARFELFLCSAHSDFLACALLFLAHTLSMGSVR
jgi:hypothetical protein